MSTQQHHAERKPKIMLMVPMLHQGGLENVCVQTARLLQPYYDVTLLIFTRKDQFFDVTGLDVVDLELPAVDGSFHKTVNLARRIQAIRKIKRKRGIELTYSFGSTANLSNVLSQAGDKIVTGFRSSVDLENERQVKLFCSRSDLVICCSQDLAQVLYRKYGYQNTTVLYNPLDAVGIREKIKARPDGIVPFSGNTAGRVLVSVGRDDDYKGYWHLIKALYVLRTDPPFSRAAGRQEQDLQRADTKQRAERETASGASAFSDVRLSFIGSGDYEAYRKLAASLGLSDVVAFPGAHTNPFPYLQHAAAFVLPSNHEGFPNALVEAMACGLPVMACDCMSGPREILCSTQEYEEISDQYPAGTSIKAPKMAGYGCLVPNMDAKKDTDPGHITEDDRKFAGWLATFLQDANMLQEYGRKAEARSEDFSYAAYTRELCRILDNVIRT